jgi:hypothetical protein
MSLPPTPDEIDNVVMSFSYMSTQSVRPPSWSHFLLFRNLPGEIRNEIWDSAVRPARPGAHSFSYLDVRAAGWKKWRDAFAVRDISFSESDWDVAGWLGAPAEPCVHKFDWEARNDSMYMHDHGLWTACRDSRAAMLRRFRSEYWAPICKGFRDQARASLVVCEPPEAPITARFLCAGEHRFLTVLPRSDLFIIRPLDRDGRMPDLHRLAAQTTLLSPRSGSVVKNIAFRLPKDYCHLLDVAFARKDKNRKKRSMIARLVESYMQTVAAHGNTSAIAENVWLINPKARIPEKASRANRQVFFAEGHKYTQLRDGEAGGLGMVIEYDILKVYNDHPGPRPFPSQTFRVRMLAVEKI